MMLMITNVCQGTPKAKNTSDPTKRNHSISLENPYDRLFFYHSILHVLLMFFFYHSVAPVEMGPRGNSGDDAPNRECYVRKELPANELPADALKQTSVPRSGPRWALNGPMKYN